MTFLASQMRLDFAFAIFSTNSRRTKDDSLARSTKNFRNVFNLQNKPIKCEIPQCDVDYVSNRDDRDPISGTVMFVELQSSGEVLS